MARAKFTPGLILRVPLDDGTHTYAKMLEHEPFLAYLDLRAGDEEPDQDAAVIARAPVLFILATVYREALSSGRWKRVGPAPQSWVDTPIPLQFHQEINDPARLSLVDIWGRMKPATFDEIGGHERWAVWSDDLVEGRLVDPYAGRENDHVRALQPVLP